VAAGAAEDQRAGIRIGLPSPVSFTSNSNIV
jgi:hypothetical protein